MNKKGFGSSMKLIMVTVVLLAIAVFSFVSISDGFSSVKKFGKNIICEGDTDVDDDGIINQLDRSNGKILRCPCDPDNPKDENQFVVDAHINKLSRDAFKDKDELGNILFPEEEHPHGLTDGNIAAIKDHIEKIENTQVVLELEGLLAKNLVSKEPIGKEAFCPEVETTGEDFVADCFADFEELYLKKTASSDDYPYIKVCYTSESDCVDHFYEVCKVS